MRRKLFARAIAWGAWFAFAAIAALPAQAANTVLPVPSVTIYPGDIIQDSYLVDRDFSSSPQMPRVGFVDSRKMLIGKLARRTLLAGMPIPLNGVTEPNAVSNGARVRVVFNQDGLDIETYATALQSGSVGELISVRNLESGVTISGIVQSDGSVRVGG